MSVLDLVKPNIDKFGFLAQSDGDAGDSVLHETDLVFCATVQAQLGQISGREREEIYTRFMSLVPQVMILDNHDPKFYGLARRHPDLTKWYSHWDRMSRDQSHFIIALAMSGDTEAFSAFMANWRRRAYLFTTNTLGNSETATKRKLPDVTLFGFWAIAIRSGLILKSKKASLLKPLLWLFDLSLLANSLIRVYYYGHDKNETDSRNHIKAMGLSKLVADTWGAKLSRWLYARMPIKFPDRPGTGAQQEVDDYFNSNGGVRGLAVLYKPVVEWILS
jgi:hypothetical protein